VIDNLHEHGGESGLLQPGFGQAALHFHAGFGIDRDGQKDVRIEQILEVIRIAGLCGSFDFLARIARQRRPQKLERLQHAGDIRRQGLPFDGNAQLGGGLAADRRRQREQTQKTCYQPAHCCSREWRVASERRVSGWSPPREIFPAIASKPASSRVLLLPRRR